MTITYQWYRDGIAIAGETSRELTLTAVTDADDGMYELRATRDGSTTTKMQSVAVQMFDLYADAVGGDDGNSGTSASAPVQTLATLKTKAEAIGSGVKIGLKRGSYWREDFDTTLENCVLEAYGVGNLPTFDGAKIVDGGDWAKTSGQTNVYEYTMTQVPSLAEGQAWEDDSVLQYVVDIATVDSTPGSYTVTGTLNGYKTTAGPVTFYIHPTGSTDPTSDGQTYEVSDLARLGRVRISSGSRATEIYCRRTCHADGAFRSSGDDTVILEDSYVTEGVKHEALIASGEFRNVVAWHPADDPRTGNIMLEFYISDAAGKYGKYIDCVAIGPAPGASQSVLGYGGHIGQGGQLYTTQSAENCVAKDCTNGIQLAALGEVYTARCLVVDCEGAFWAGSASASTHTDDAILNTNVDLLYGYQADSGGKTTIEGLRANVRGVTSRGVIYKTSKTIFKDSSIYCNSGTSRAILTDLQPPTAVVENVVTENVRWWINHSGSSDAVQLSNNVIDPRLSENGTVATFEGQFYSAIASYLSAVQPDFEVGTELADPGFTDPANLDFTPTNSDVIGHGCARPVVNYRAIPTVAEIKAARSAE